MTETKRVYIDMWGRETNLQRKRLIAEVPADCEDEVIAKLDSDKLHDFVCESVFDTYWETEEEEDFEVLSDIYVEPCPPHHQGMDVRLLLDENGDLVIKTEEE